MKGAEVFVIREINAANIFIDNAMEQFGFTQEEAKKILAIYREHKIVKLDRTLGVYQLKHGVFWDKYPMTNALNM